MGSCTKKTALELGLPSTVVHSMLSKKEVKNYIDRIYFETGFRNRDKVASVMDELISRKLEELDESEMGSSKDIAELIELQHKLKMQEMKMNIEMMKVEQANIIKQTNVQVNNVGSDGYNSFMDKLLGK